VLLAAYVFVVVILSRAWRGELTKNAAEDAVAAILEAMDKLEERVRQLEEPG
jgi:ribosome-associated translation inhibitor RaiA